MDWAQLRVGRFCSRSARVWLLSARLAGVAQLAPSREVELSVVCISRVRSSIVGTSEVHALLACGSFLRNEGGFLSLTSAFRALCCHEEALAWFRTLMWRSAAFPGPSLAVERLAAGLRRPSKPSQTLSVPTFPSRWELCRGTEAGVHAPTAKPALITSSGCLNPGRGSPNFPV